MGNQHSSSSSPVDIDRLRPFARNGGALGLSRTELDKRCQPSGLYGACHWDERTIRRLIADGKIAAREKGKDSPDNTSGATEECPICFLSYNAVNVTRCCHATICTECFLQVRPQKEKDSTCPFCNCENFSVEISKTDQNSSDEDVEKMTCTSSLTTNAVASHANGVGTLKKKSIASVAPVAPDTPPPPKIGGFGSQLEKDGRFKMLKKRSESFASAASGTSTPKKEEEMLGSIAMTPEERQRLEDEMQAQHYHPLVLRLENEAQERRLENDRAYERNNSARNSESTGSSGRRLRTRGGLVRSTWDNTSGQNDDVANLERVIMYTMGEGNNGRSNQGQSEGFPLLRSLLTGHMDNNTANSNTGRRSAGWVRRQRALNAMGMMMLSEEEQISMAIAASMRDQEENQQNDDGSSISSNEAEDEGETPPTTDHDDDTRYRNGETTDDNNQNENDTPPDTTDDVIPTEENIPAVVLNESGDEASTITELARVVTDTESRGVTA